MMMKLMKVFVVALVAVIVLAATKSQAIATEKEVHKLDWSFEDQKFSEGAELLLIKCTPDYYDPSFGERPLTMWFTIDLERETVKSWTHDLKVGDGKHKEWGDRKQQHSYIDISDSLFKILLKSGVGVTDTRISIVRMTGEWNYKNTREKVMGRCKKMNDTDGQRMELHHAPF